MSTPKLNHTRAQVALKTAERLASMGIVFVPIIVFDDEHQAILCEQAERAAKNFDTAINAAHAKKEHNDG